MPQHHSRRFRPVILVLVLLAVAGLGSQAVERRVVSLIVSGGTVVTMGADGAIFAPGAVAIDGRDIVAVGGPSDIASRFEGRESIDATGQVVLPGLVNTHTHAAMVMYRGLADDLKLMEWLERYIFPAEAKTVSPEMVRVGTRLAALEMIRSGTTTFADMYYFEEVVARVAREAGLRGVLGQTIIGFPVADAKTPVEGLARAEAYLRAFANDDLVVPALAPHSMYTVDGPTLNAVRQMADRHGSPILIHVSETRDEVAKSREQFGATPFQYLERLGFLGPRIVAAHCVWVTADEIPLLARRAIGVSHNPESNMKLASGTAPVPGLLASKVTVGLGTDGAASNNDLDMFEAMRMAALLHKLQSGDPTVIGAPVALAMATIEGAKVLGLDRLVGSLEPGKRADLITVTMAGPRQTPMYNAVSHLVYVSRGDDVETTIVNGRILMRDRKVLSLDEAAVLAEARALAERVRAAVQR